jgi:hypothetical protein
VKGYDLAKYPGRVHRDGVQALIDTVMASPEPMTLIAIGPPPNLKAALEREPRIAGKLRLAGMYGSLHRGYDAKAKPEPEWNVKASPAAAAPSPPGRGHLDAATPAASSSWRAALCSSEGLPGPLARAVIGYHVWTRLVREGCPALTAKARPSSTRWRPGDLLDFVNGIRASA